MNRRIVSRLSAVALCLLPMSVAAQTPPTNADALLALRAFRCWGYAERAKENVRQGQITKPTAEQELLFNIGYRAVIKFLAAFRRGEISENTVPVGVLYKIQGPSDDFIFGRIFEDAAGGARIAVYALVSEETHQKSPDETAFRQKATNLFQSENCSAIK